MKTNKFKCGQALLQGMLLFAALDVGSAVADGPALLTDTGGVLPKAVDNEPEFITNVRYTHINTAALFDKDGKPFDAAALPEIGFNLFPTADFTGVVSKVEQDAGTTTWTGKLKGVPKGYFIMVAVDGAFIAHVASPQGVYEVSNVGGDVYKVVQIDHSKMQDDPPGEMDTAGEAGPVLKKNSLGSNADTGATLDVMVMYTTTARTAEGSTAAMKARVALAVAETNQAYANAGVTPRLRLVHTEEITYTESGNIQTDVNRLTATTDGHMDIVHNLRNIYGADMVSLIVENGGGYCGIAKAIMATAATAFDVTARSCATGYYSFGHEFGHLQGARHDTYVDPTNTPYAYGHGHTYPPGSWRTVMAYNNACTAVGKNCTRLQYFSNPTKTYNTKPMGVAGTSENYRVLNNTAYTVANFRTTVIGPDFVSSFNGSSAGWTAVKGGWGVNTAYYYTSGIAGYSSSAVHSDKYGDITYQAVMKRAGSDASFSNRLIIRGNPFSLDAGYWWKPSYVFQYTNSGYFSVYKLSAAGTATALKAWTASATIVKGGWNALKVVAVGPTLKFYINNILVWSGSDGSYLTGWVGVGLYRDTTSTGNWFYVDSASLSTTPTAADLRSNQPVAPGIEVPGGDADHSP